MPPAWSRLYSVLMIVVGAVAWPGELDLAPDTMHREIQEHGAWVLTAGQIPQET